MYFIHMCWTIKGFARGLNAPVRRVKKNILEIIAINPRLLQPEVSQIETHNSSERWLGASLPLSRRSFCRSAGTHGDFHGFATTGRIETSLLSEQRGTPSAGRPRDRDDVSLRVGDDGQDDDNDRRSWNEITALRALKVDLRTASMSAGRYADNFAQLDENSFNHLLSRPVIRTLGYKQGSLFPAAVLLERQTTRLCRYFYKCLTKEY